jgi:hypothetical protein
MLLVELYQERKNSTFTHDDVEYDLNKVLKAVDEQPVEKYRVSELKWILKHTSVDKERVKKANKRTPILVTKWKNKLVVLDGAHRLTKAVENGDSELSGKYVTKEVLKKAKKP